MKYWITFFVCFLICCKPAQSDTREEVRYRRVCNTDEERIALAESILECARSANPKNEDADGEELVLQCERSMQRSLCPLRRVKILMNDYQELDERLDDSSEETTTSAH